MLTGGINAALELARHGLHVVKLHFPISRPDGTVACSCGTDRCIETRSQGKHPVLKAWGKAATNDQDVLREQFGVDRPWNVGILLGTAGGIPVEQAVVDIEDDTEEGRQLAEALFRDFPTVSWTSGKSIHRLYRFNPLLPKVASCTIRGMEVRIGGTDLQTQSVAPPSLHRTGARYEWMPGRAIGEIPIAMLPDHLAQLIAEEYTQIESRRSGPSSADHRKFGKPREKVHEPGRNNALLRVCNVFWREACKVHGFNLLSDADVRDAVWTRLAGANLLTCEPPVPESECWQVFVNSERFMLRELQREMEERERKQMEMASPVPEPIPAGVIPAGGGTESGPAVAVIAVGSAAEADSRSFGAYLHAAGIRLQPDPRFDSDDGDNPDRIDQWVCNWQLTYQDCTERSQHRLTVQDWTIDLTETELDKPRIVARKVYQASDGRLQLDRTFAFWAWDDIWKGRVTKKNGIKRGLREYLENHATLLAAGDDGLAGMVEELVTRLVGPVRLISQKYCDAPVPFAELVDRIRLTPNGELSNAFIEGDPISGVYMWKQSLHTVLKTSEIAQQYGKMFGRRSEIGVKELAKVLRQLGYHDANLRRGRPEGRCWVREIDRGEE